MKKVSREVLLQRGPRHRGGWVTGSYLYSAQSGRLAYANGCLLTSIDKACAFGGKILALVEPGKSIKVRVTVEVLDD